MVQKIVLLTLSVWAMSFSPSKANALTNICNELFADQEVIGLRPNQFGILGFNVGAGRNFLSIGTLMGSTTIKGVTYLTLTSDSGSLREYDSRGVFVGIPPVRARALVVDSNKAHARPESHFVTLVGARKNGDRDEFIARRADGQLVQVWYFELLD